ncbi:MAG: hypothetical protein ACXVB0_25330, partial [Mucilaginibacter sp.]
PIKNITLTVTISSPLVWIEKFWKQFSDESRILFSLSPWLSDIDAFRQTALFVGKQIVSCIFIAIADQPSLTQ